MTLIYGVDTEKPVTPKMIRKAIEVCFLHAHQKEINSLKEFAEKLSEQEFETLKKNYARDEIIKAFKECDGVYENPTKENLICVVSKLKEFSENFRKPEVVEKHVSEIMTLIKLI